MENKEPYLQFKGRVKRPKYYIGVDKYKGSPSCYCLTRELNGTVDIILIKRSNNEEEFDAEVNNLAKYFNATIIKEK